MRPLCGRAVLYSMRHASMVTCASASVQNHVSFRHSPRRRPLNDSANAFCTGLPGWMNSSRTPRRCAHWSSARPANSGPLSHTIPLGTPRVPARRSIGVMSEPKKLRTADVGRRAGGAANEALRRVAANEAG